MEIISLLMDQSKTKNTGLLIFHIESAYKFQVPKQIHIQDIRGLILSQIATKRSITLVIYDAVSPKVNQHFYIWSGYCIPNINFI